MEQILNLQKLGNFCHKDQKLIRPADSIQMSCGTALKYCMGKKSRKNTNTAGIQ
jgi:hypothetical protein